MKTATLITRINEDLSRSYLLDVADDATEQHVVFRFGACQNNAELALVSLDRHAGCLVRRVVEDVRTVRA